MIGLLMATGAAGGLLGAFTARPLARLIGEGPGTWLSLGVTSPLALVQPFLHRNGSAVDGVLRARSGRP